ncbi:alpha/beta hydrolase [Deinococcus koreensis]|uniref:Carboxylesterase n=1 Tax=Deinococcus koreensis TaxID=2054903 RepID=A0A2K3UTI1_9DEIO|nr:alpha/beta hydrolase [Deinococcus koreensis]PNY79837.1 carboxylesterase [Deinococcus koreensis]
MNAPFHLTRPPRTPAPGRAPTLILLHGVGANETSLLGLAAQLDPRFQIISVRAPLELHPGGYGFFHVQFTPEPVIVAEEAEASRQALAELIPALAAEYGLDPARIYVLGFSQGAIMGASLALSRPELVAGLVMLSGRILPEARPTFAAGADLARLPVFVGHGVHDAKLGIHHGRASRTLLSELGVRLSYHEYEMGHEVSAAEIADLNAWLAARLAEGTGAVPQPVSAPNLEGGRPEQR